VSDNIQPRLETPKCQSFLQASCCLVNLVFYLFRSTDCLHKCGPARIDAIN
jgi:hypothetical protein